MDLFTNALNTLNTAQSKAVKTTDGPVLVVAGPGTGKTQLLSVRIAAILNADSGVLPSNILCLTFTDAAAANLRERLIEKIGLGQAAYQVAIHTFNSFGSWIMSTYPEYFYAWREAATADELTSYRIVESILAQLPGDHTLAARSYDESFFAIKQTQNFISDLKKSNLSPQQARQVLSANLNCYSQYTPIFAQHWPARMLGQPALDAINRCIEALDNAATPAEPVNGITPLSKLMLQDLHAAQAASAELTGASRTKPLTAWRNKWLELDENKNWVFISAKHHDKLLAAVDVYQKYQQELSNQGLVDFNDQIVTVLAALEKHQELRLNLQERFQYVMIDEYQDTNRSQLQMAHYLTDAAVHEGRPNIMVVGDDDQAIYRFQGADMSNIAAFEAAYRDPIIIRLDQNYRSNQDVLGPARSISTQIQLSLEKLKGISKELGINVDKQGVGTKLHEFEHETGHYAWVAAQIKHCLAQTAGTGKDVAVLARQRDQLDALVPYLRDQQVPIDYERRENVLEQEHVVALLTIARAVHYLSAQRLEDANAILPEVLSHPMWQIPPADIWQIAREAHTRKILWLDVIFEQADTPLKKICNFLFGLSQQATTLPLEQTLDTLIGLSEQTSTAAFTSPYKNYYFGEDLFNNKPAEYLTLLSHLACLRRHLNNYQLGSKRMLTLGDLIQFTDAYQRAGLTMIDTAPHREDPSSVKLMTAHKAKGQEFDTVFVIGLTESVWNKPGGSRKRFSYPQNLAEIKPSDNDSDDALRLLFVAMTRARQNLHLSYFKKSEDGKSQQLFAPVLAAELPADTPQPPTDATALTAQYEQRWLSRHAGVEQASKHAMLADKLQNYRLSATHLNNYLDVSRGGPLFFLTQNLLRFPSGTSPQACYGVIVHDILRRAHEQVLSGQKPDADQLIEVFKTKLAAAPLSPQDRAHLAKRGDDNLRLFLGTMAPYFNQNQKPEVDFSNQGVTVGHARLTGSLDLIELNSPSRTIAVSDYKTGKPFYRWDLPPSSSESDRLKLHRYRRQLLFYKILVDGSSDWGAKGWVANNAILNFVEPDAYGKLRTLAIDYEPEELEHTKHLIQAVWQRIMALDFPDISEQYSPDLAGTVKFENYLLDSH